MTIEEFIIKIDKANVPYNASIMSDSGWECDPTECSRAFYNADENTVILTQLDPPSRYDHYDRYIEL